MYTLILCLGLAAAAVIFAGRRYDVLSRLSTAYLRLRYPIKSVDGHRELPTLPFVWPNGQGNIEKYLKGRENSIKWGSEYGFLYRIWSGFHGEIIVTRPNDIETVFRDSHTHLKANANDSGYLMYELLGSCLGLVSGSEWRSIRKATEAPFTRTATATYVRMVQNHAREHLEPLWKEKTEKWQLRPYADLRVYPFFALADILYGKLTPELKTRLLEIIPGRDSVFAHMMRGGVTRYPWSRFLPLKALRELRDFKTIWGHWNDDAHAEALKKVQKGEAAPIVQMYAAVESGSISREALLQTLDEMLFANLDVSIVALAWAFVFIAAYPHVQARLLSELKTELSDPERSDAYLMSQSNYLHHILLEGGRLRPAAPFSVAQACPSQRQLGPFNFPSGSKFVVDSSALNVRDPLWAPDNSTFRPERWSQGGAEGVVDRAKDVRYCYWRFGFGPRVCLGKYVVDLMMKALIVEVVQKYEVKIEDEHGEPWVFDEDVWSLDPKMRIACVKRKEV